MGKRVVASKPGEHEQSDKRKEVQDDTIESEAIQPIMAELMDKSYIFDLDPRCCIPMYLSRRKSAIAVRKLKNIFTGKNSNTNALSGIISGSPTAVVVELTGDLNPLVSKYFIDAGYAPEDVIEKKSTYNNWYGVIDGCQFHGALMELAEDNPKEWLGYKWKVLVVQSGKQLSDYRKLARNQNERNKQKYQFETTVYDLLHGLRLEYDELYNQAVKQSRTGRRGIKVNHREVARNYDGGQHIGNTYVKQAVTVASRLSHKAIEAIGTICNLDCTDIMSNNDSSTSSVNEHVNSKDDCRLFKSFVHFWAFRSAKAFMNAMNDGLEDAQVNTIHRLKYWSEANQYKSAQSKIVVEQFKLAVFALQEEAKFLKYINEDEWPANMDTTKENILRTTVLDQELNSNNGNDTDILPSILRCFTRLYPAKAKAIELQKDSITSDIETQPSHPSTEKEKDQPSSQGVDESELMRVEEERKKKQEMEEARNKRRRADEYLSESKIYSHCMNSQDYCTHVLSPSTPKADLVITSLPNDISLQNLKSIPSFCKKVLKPGSYAFIIVTEDQYILLHQLFNQLHFKVIERSYKILYDTSSVQRKGSSDFPLRHGDIAIIAKTEGHHPDQFHPFGFSKSNTDIQASSAMFDSVVNVKTCTSKLKKPGHYGALRTSEKSVELFSFIIKMLTPPGGIVIDPHAGPMTASLACLQTGRSCVSIEDEHLCYKYALGRTRIYATPEATMKDLPTFVDFKR